MDILKIREFIRNIVIKTRYLIFVKVYKMNIHKEARISVGVKLDKVNPKGIYIGSETYIASGTIILTHDSCRKIKRSTYIGKKCFIGVNSIIMPGVKIGDEVIIGAGSVVTKDIPSNSIAAGNPAKIIKKNIKTKKYGHLIKDNCQTL